MRQVRMIFRGMTRELVFFHFSFFVFFSFSFFNRFEPIPIPNPIHVKCHIRVSGLPEIVAIVHALADSRLDAHCVPTSDTDEIRV